MKKRRNCAGNTVHSLGPCKLNESETNQAVQPSENGTKSSAATVPLGDSMVKEKTFLDLMLEKNYKAFSAARISEMEPFIQPTLVQALSQIVLHCETNSLKQMILPDA